MKALHLQTDFRCFLSNQNLPFKKTSNKLNKIPCHQMEVNSQTQILQYHQKSVSSFIDVYCRLHNGNGCCFQIPLTTTIASLIGLLRQSELNLPPEFELVHSGQHLLNLEMTLKEVGIKDKAIIHIFNKTETSPKYIKIDVIVYWKGQKLVLRARTSETILNLKQKLYRLLQLQPKNQRLIFRGVVLDNSKTLSELKIESDSLLCLHYQDCFSRDLSNSQQNVKQKELLESAQSLDNMNPQIQLKLFRSAEGVRWQVFQNFPIYQVQIRQLKIENQFNTRNFNFNLFTPSHLTSSITTQKCKNFSLLNTLLNQGLLDSQKRSYKSSILDDSTSEGILMII